MKKLSFSRLLWLFFLAPGWLVAADLSTKAISVGEVSLLIGSVIATDGEGAKRTLNRGAFVYEKDTIETAAGGHAHLHFVDDGVVSLRPNSRLKIDSYVFDAQNPGQNSIRLNLESGVLRSISGKVTKDAHERFRLNTPITAVGVLGTDFLVRAEAEKMWAAVFSGVIAVAPLNDMGCTTAGLGACANALRLSAGMGDLMFEYDDQNGVQRIIERDDNLPKESSGFQGSAEQGLGNLGQIDGSSSEINAARQVQSLGLNIELSPFAWGRWHGLSWDGDSLSQSFKQASQGRQGTVGSRHFALFQDQTEPVDLPFGMPVQYDFKLVQGQVHFVENAPTWVIPSITAGTLTEGRLSVNFANQQIATYLNMSHPVWGDAVLDLTGSVDSRGIFTARDNTSMAAGALSQQGQHAGMLFERSVEGGVFHGISTWEKR
ncbi:MAG TPA: hypothetical protein EYG29_00820 [Methylococcales bacterium]|nr:hypothetical protein [Methylococcales bacterium]